MEGIFWILLLILHAGLFIIFYCLGRNVKKNSISHRRDHDLHLDQLGSVDARVSTNEVTEIDFLPPPAYEDLALKGAQEKDVYELPSYNEALNLKQFKS